MAKQSAKQKAQGVHRVMLTVDEEHYGVLDKKAQAKYSQPGAIQKLIRYNVIPDWLRENPDAD
jgi:hypothetical protein